MKTFLLKVHLCEQFLAGFLIPTHGNSFICFSLACAALGGLLQTCLPDVRSIWYLLISNFLYIVVLNSVGHCSLGLKPQENSCSAKWDRTEQPERLWMLLELTHWLSAYSFPEPFCSQWSPGAWQVERSHPDYCPCHTKAGSHVEAPHLDM